jgi:hypothetical protein
LFIVFILRLPGVSLGHWGRTAVSFGFCDFALLTFRLTVTSPIAGGLSFFLSLSVSLYLLESVAVILQILGEFSGWGLGHACRETTRQAGRQAGRVVITIPIHVHLSRTGFLGTAVHGYLFSFYDVFLP